MALNIRPAEQCKWDGAALGEVMIRFDPVDVPFERARTCRIWHSGGEVKRGKKGGGVVALR